MLHLRPVARVLVAIASCVACLAQIAPRRPAERPLLPDPSETHLVLSLPGQDSVRPREDIIYRRAEDRDLKMDLYLPPGAKTRPPVVVLVSGAADSKRLGGFRDMGRLLAVSGLAAVTYDKRFPRGTAGLQTGAEDTMELLRHLRSHEADYGIDADRTCLWVFSAGGALLSTVLRGETPQVRCAVSYYGVADLTPFMTEAPEQEREQARAASPAWVIQGARAVPSLLIVRAGLDAGQLNEGIDRLVQRALERNADLTVVNYADGHHAFDVLDDNERSREVLRATLEWIRRRTR